MCHNRSKVKEQISEARSKCLLKRHDANRQKGDVRISGVNLQKNINNDRKKWKRSHFFVIVWTYFFPMLKYIEGRNTNHLLLLTKYSDGTRLYIKQLIKSHLNGATCKHVCCHVLKRCHFEWKKILNRHTHKTIQLSSINKFHISN